MARRTLAEGSLTRLEICSCGSCYLTIGPVTVSIHREVIEELSQTITSALAQLRTRENFSGGAEPFEGSDENREQTRTTAAWGPPRSN
jgi:hypothetical protein